VHQSVAPEQLHNLRAALVQNDTLAFMAVKHGMHKHLLHSSTALQNEINSFTAVRGTHLFCTTHVRVASSSTQVLGDSHALRLFGILAGSGGEAG
jgi:endoribonuclease Dicer